MDIWFTSDTHFYHKNIIEYCNRPFADVEEMNAVLLKNWNDRVAPNDHVYHLGDVALGSGSQAAEVIWELNGKIFLIKGNHESCAQSKWCRDRFEWIKDYHELKLSKTKSIILCHYPFASWNKKHYNSWHLFGHRHGKYTPPEGDLAYDAGVDTNDYRPINVEEVEAIFNRIRFGARSSSGDSGGTAVG